ncbi:MAG: TonB-dependent receptor [Vicingaceae bacterium]
MNKQSILAAIILVALALLIPFHLAAQNPTQTVRGKIVDTDTKTGIPFANVVIANTDPLMGSTSDMDGNFKIEKVPVGRLQIKVSYVGYESLTLPNVLLIAGKEKVLTIELKESFHELDEVVIEGSKKNESINEMALMSSKQLSVEESKRHAGAISDPARLVSSFAGVINEGTGNNDIIVRGNNPRFIQWRLEGIEIPNPNHFAEEGLTGGPINALNSNLLANSDFYTGAFAPEYGNALSGIFDMRLRNGNNEKAEYSFSLGVLGTDLTAEGPFKNDYNGSYLVNYRYSTLALLDGMGAVDFGGVPKYQDMNFKVFLPTEKAGVFSVFGLGGISEINGEDTKEDNEEIILEEFVQNSELAVGGVNHFIPLSKKSYLKSTASYAATSSKYTENRPYGSEPLKEFNNSKLDRSSLRFATTFNHKLNSRHQFQLGLRLEENQFDFNSRYYELSRDAYYIGQQNEGSAALYRSFGSWQWRINEQLTAVSGLHLSKSSLNDQIVVEPRTALRYQYNETQSFTAGFGMHSKMGALPNHFAAVQAANGNYSFPNKNLEMLRATHYVIGYENALRSNLFLKLEAYYQDLFNMPVERNANSDFSVINQRGSFTDVALVNEGEGRNIGFEVTLERFFSKDYYFLITASLYDAKYKTFAGEWEDSRYNGNYTANALAGKEFKVGKGDNKTLAINTRVTLIGGRRYTPIDLQASITSGEEVQYQDQTFGKKAPDASYLNLAVSYRVEKTNLSHEVKIDVQNVLNAQTPIDYYFSETTQEIENIPQLATLPVISYTISF